MVRATQFLLNGLFTFLFYCLCCCRSPHSPAVQLVPIAKGWAQNSINTVIFRRNAVVTHGNFQYTAFYDGSGDVILAKRRLDSDNWMITRSRYQGRVKDAHCSISIMVDGEGYLHMAWNHHGDSLNYCRSRFPESPEFMDRQTMTGKLEFHITYPEFYRLPDGNLIFLFRDGSSGNGNLIMKYYDTGKKIWSDLHLNLIDGEGERNAYWQMAVAPDGSLHLSWVWRETWDVATNHDLCYAVSDDQGKTWHKSTCKPYSLPITAETAEYTARIPQGSELINQTAMCVDSAGHPYIASYWAPSGTDIPQFHLIWNDGRRWKVQQITNRRTPFSLKGGGTKKIPVSRPQILVDNKTRVYVIYRDKERKSRVTVAVCNDLKNNIWTFQDLTDFSVNQWEPVFDTELWNNHNILHLFLQATGQGDAEQTENIPPQMVYILEARPVSRLN